RVPDAGRTAARTPPEERPVAQRRPGDVPVAVQAVRAPSGGEQAGDRLARPVEHPRVQIRVQPTEGEALRLEGQAVEVVRPPGTRRVGAEGRLERPDPPGVLAELRVLAPLGAG